MRKALFFVIIFNLFINNIPSQGNEFVIFSQDETEIINLLFSEYINYHTDTEILILKLEIIWDITYQELRLNRIRNKINDDQLIDNFIYRNKNRNGKIDSSNVFNVENVIFMTEEEFNLQYESQLITERGFTNNWFTNSTRDNLTFAEIMEKYEKVRIKRTYITISWIGFNEAGDKAFVSFECLEDHLIPTRRLVYLFFLKENDVWIVNDINEIY
jgi:hypothetical protein